MSFLYDRTEKQDEIVIVYKYQAAWYIILLVFLLSIPFIKPDQSTQQLMVVALVALACIQIFGKGKTRREIKQAMQNGKVQISGSKFSFSHPLTFTIKK